MYRTPHLDRLYRALVVPDQPISPPEPDEKTIERNLRNSIRGDCLDAIGTLMDRLEELSDEHGNGFRNTLNFLKELKDYLERDMETDD